MDAPYQRKEVIGNCTLYLGDSLDVLPTLSGIHACVTDPPYELGFMGKGWDASGIANSITLWERVNASLLPGAHLLAFSGSRTYHRMTCAIEDAGFDIRDQIMWLYGCLDEQTEVATAEGIKPYHKTNVGDLVLCYDAEHGEYSYQPILEIVEYDYADTAYRLIGDFGEQVVSRNHRCIVERDGREVFRFAETLQCEANIPVLESLPELQRVLSNIQSNSSDSQSDMRSGLYGGSNRQGQQRSDTNRAAPGKNQSYLLCVQEGLLPQHEAQGTGCEARMLDAVQWHHQGCGMGEARAQGTRELVGRIGSGITEANDGTDESRLARGLNLPQSEGSLCQPAHQVCSLSAGVLTNGESGRLCDGTPADRSEGAEPIIDADRDGSPQEPRCDAECRNQSDAVCYERTAQGIRAWRGHKTTMVRVVPFHYVGKVWCLRVPTGAFVAVRSGVAFPTGNSGFPKSLDVSKALDRMGGQPWSDFAALLDRLIKDAGYNYTSLDRALGIPSAGSNSCYWVRADERGGLPPRRYYEQLKDLLSPPAIFTDLYDKAEREVIAIEQRRNAPSGIVSSGRASVDVDRLITAPVTAAASQWQGWGTALKPAHEPIAMARKPLIGTVAANVLAHCTGAINVDGCRVGDDVRTASFTSLAPRHGNALGQAGTAELRRGTQGDPKTYVGRWPANLIHDGSEEVLQAFAAYGEKPSRLGKKQTRTAGGSVNSYRSDAMRGVVTNCIDDTGTASRFFYCAKASKSDREEGNRHPTVKPSDLMRYLCRLVTPPGGIVLDPFMGSGSTGKAAVREVFGFIGIEQDPEYFEIACDRIQRAHEKGARPIRTNSGAAPSVSVNDNTQLGLFDVS